MMRCSSLSLHDEPGRLGDRLYNWTRQSPYVISLYKNVDAEDVPDDKPIIYTVVLRDQYFTLVELAKDAKLYKWTGLKPVEAAGFNNKRYIVLWISKELAHLVNTWFNLSRTEPDEEPWITFEDWIRAL